MGRPRHKFNRKKLLATLGALTLIFLVLPREITRKFINLTQVIVPFQDWANRSVSTAKDSITGADQPVSRDEWDKVVRQNQALTHQIVALASRYESLERQHASLAGIRQRGLSGGRLISARVIAADASPLSESRLVNSGRLSGVRDGAAVASSYFTVEQSTGQEVQSGMSVLSGETLVGFVDQVGTHVARVRLLSDVGMELTVNVARLTGDKYYPLDADFWMVGVGSLGTGLQIRDVNHRYVKSGSIQIGDVVLTSQSDTRLPAPLNVGTITDIQPDPDNSLLYRLAVTPAESYDKIRNVFVVDPVAGTP